jgi:CBS domain-containing protein
MEKHKKIKDFIIPVQEHPHLPYWGTLKEAVVQLNLAYEQGHQAVLVFDEAYQLVGMLSQKDILQALGPKLAHRHKESAPLLWNEQSQNGIRDRLSRPIKDFMSKAKTTLELEDPILKAAQTMLQNGDVISPVMDGNKLIGVARLKDLFHEITNLVLTL